MDYYKRFDKYFLYKYYNEINEIVGVFSKDTPGNLKELAEKVFDIVEYE